MTEERIAAATDQEARELRTVLTGWFGVPGGPVSRSTKVHIVWRSTRLPICGTRLGDDQRFQFCAAGVHEDWVDCRRCVKTRAYSAADYTRRKTR